MAKCSKFAGATFRNSYKLHKLVYIVQQLQSDLIILNHQAAYFAPCDCTNDKYVLLVRPLSSCHPVVLYTIRVNRYMDDK